MEKSIADFTAVLKEMQADRVEERKTFDSVRLALEANTAVVKEISGWRPHVESKMDDLRSGLQDLEGKVDRLALSGKEQFRGRWYERRLQGVRHRGRRPHEADDRPSGRFLYIGGFRANWPRCCATSPGSWLWGVTIAMTFGLS